MLYRATRRVLPFVALLATHALAGETGDRVQPTPRAERAVQPLRGEVETESPDLASKLSRPLSLDDCIGIALSRNIPLMVARGSLDASQARAGGAIGQFLPELRVGAARARIERNADREYVAYSLVTATNSSRRGTAPPSAASLMVRPVCGAN